MKKSVIAFLVILYISIPVFSQDPIAIGVVNDNGLRLRSSPELSGEIVTTLDKNTIVKIHTEEPVKQVINGYDGNWVRITTVNGLTGWIYDQWLDSYNKGNFYIPENDFNTIRGHTYTSDDFVIFQDTEIETSILVDKDEISKLVINKYTKGIYQYSWLIKIDGFKFYGHHEDWLFETYVNVAPISQDDYIVSCILSRDRFLLFRIRNGTIIWSRGYELEQIIGSSMKFDGNKHVYLALQHGSNFDQSNYDIHLLKMDTNGNFVKSCNIATPEWDSIESLAILNSHLFMIGNYNGLDKPRIIKIDQDLRIVKQGNLLFADPAFSIKSTAHNSNTLFISSSSGFVRNKNRMLSAIVSISEDLEVNWTRGFMGDDYNTDEGLYVSEDSVVILGKSVPEYAYSQDKKKDRYWFVELDTQGERVHEYHLLFPRNITPVSFSKDNNAFHFFGRMATRVSGNSGKSFDFLIMKTGFNFLSNLQPVTGKDISIRPVQVYHNILNITNDIIKNTDVQLESFFPLVQAETFMLPTSHSYPWSAEVQEDAVFFELSER